MGCSASKGEPGHPISDLDDDFASAAQQNFVSDASIGGEPSQEQEAEIPLSAGANLTLANIVAVVKVLGLSPILDRFLETWFRNVYQKASDNAEPISTYSLGQWFNVSTDLTAFEVGITSSPEHMVDLAKSFVEEVAGKGRIENEQIEKMKMVLELVQPQKVSLWCRLKRIGQETASADAGFAIIGHLEWCLTDLLLPPHHDKDLFRHQAEMELLTPNMYSSSIFNVEPEQSLRVVLPLDNDAPALVGIFYFKALGFAKPEDAAVNLMVDLPFSMCCLTVSMGPQGLTRLKISFHMPRRDIAAELATAVGFSCLKEKCSAIGELLEADSDLVEFVAECRGYTVSKGYHA